MSANDHFSSISKEYRSFRPKYPDDLFKHLSSLVPTHDLAWDCATGSGQAAVELSKYFKNVVATDMSGEQLSCACSAPNIKYFVANAEHSGLKDESLDLITVAQALHWFNLDLFYAEANRVLKPNGVLASWVYTLLFSDNADINEIIEIFYHDIIAEFWPPERQYVDRYEKIPFPLNEIKMPTYSISVEWTLDNLCNYFSTWSAVKYYRKVKNIDPISTWFIPEIQSAGYDMKRLLQVNFPLVFKVGKFT